MTGTRTLYVITHPESRHHVEGRVGGWFDSSLTEHGRSQARSIAAELRRRIPADASAEVVTSDLARTRETAEVVAEALGTRAEVAAGLREKSYGIAEGREQSWLDERFVFPPKPGDVGAALLDHQVRLDHDEGIEGAETRRELGARVYEAMDEILARPAAHQVIVTHGFAHTFVIGRWLELPLDSMGWAAFAARSGCITELTEDAAFGNRTLRRLADVDHLGEN
ncbi:histidine phosphatase family protein [Brevibacterium atlanticum]|uniref:histidine phosphatase family protein n=1 Tax=Brevibacterium atlanticum TaxID=2697563 RepID=UPI0014206846|nr:histidine phosphatase family protein [Brevibacterium atlanticum]